MAKFALKIFPIDYILNIFSLIIMNKKVLFFLLGSLIGVAAVEGVRKAIEYTFKLPPYEPDDEDQEGIKSETWVGPNGE